MYILNTRVKALDEIDEIDTLLHRSKFKNSAKFLKIFSHFFSFISKLLHIFFKFCQKFTDFDEIFPEQAPSPAALAAGRKLDHKTYELISNQRK